MLNKTSFILALAGRVLAQSSVSAPSPSVGAMSAASVAPSASGLVASQALTATTSVSLLIDPNLPQSALTGVEGYTPAPLSELTSNAPTATTVPLDTTYSAGAQPTVLLGAPALPSPVLTVANYPPLDLLPPTDSPEVQQWLSQIDFSKVPNYNATDGTCAGSPGAITDGRCWWTCGGCTRETDITECPDKLTWGISYDDGPSPYTPVLLDYLNEVNLTTTFFVVGSRVLSRPQMLQSEHMAGHQISVHTWSHQYLTKLTNEGIVAELGWTKKVIKDVIGVTPNTFRPPYGDIDDRVRAIAAQMGLTPILWSAITENGTTTNFDTTDWNIPGGQATGESSLTKFEQILNVFAPRLDTGFIVLAHDIYQQTVDLSVGYVLPMALSKGQYQLKSIIDCLGQPLSEAYIETSSNKTETVIASAASTVFQPSVGTGATPAASGSAAGSARPSASGSGASAAAATGSAGHMSDVRFRGAVPELVSLAVVGLGMIFAA